MPASSRPFRSITALTNPRGNTDQHGEETRNFVISQRRAEAVVDYLVAQGIDPARLTTQPAGESKALRFARVKRYRPDKAASDADTIETLQALLP